MLSAFLNLWIIGYKTAKGDVMQFAPTYVERQPLTAEEEAYNFLPGDLEA